MGMCIHQARMLHATSIVRAYFFSNLPFIVSCCPSPFPVCRQKAEGPNACDNLSENGRDFSDLKDKGVAVAEGRLVVAVALFGIGEATSVRQTVSTGR
jgi:hypothetical protein